jgi:hypothetical protein
MRFFRPLIAILGGIAASLLVWTQVPKQLHISTRIVGYATWASFNFLQWKDLYYILAFLFPGVVALIFFSFDWFSRLLPSGRGQKKPKLLPIGFSASPWIENLAEPVSHAETATSSPVVSPVVSPVISPESPAAAGATGPRSLFWGLCRTLLPALAIAVEVSTLTPTAQRLTPLALVAAVGYVGATSCLAWVHWRSRPLAKRWSLATSLAKVNAIFATSTIALLYLVSLHTTVYVSSTKKFVHYPWLPLWLVVGGTLAALLIVLIPGSKRDAAGTWQLFEGKFLSWGIGPVLLFLLLARIAGNAPESLASSLSGQTMPAFWGFDDSHWLALPRLMFQHGLFPWRDVYTIHGLLQDVFAGQVGLSIFSYSWWGAWAGLGMLVIPGFWICQYLFVVYVSRGNLFIPLTFGIAVVAGLLGGEYTLFSTRFMFLPVIVILFGQLLRRPSGVRIAAFTTLLFINCIIAPEILIFALIFVGTLGIFEAVSYDRTKSFRRNFKRLEGVAILGLGFGACWTVYLVATHSLKAFLQFVPFFAFNRSEEVAFVINGWFPRSDYLVDLFFALPLLLWWATLWRVGRKLRLRQAWSSFDWLLIVTGIIAITYLTKAIDIPDQWHVVESLSVSIPLLALWAALSVKTANSYFHNRSPRLALGRHRAMPRFGGNTVAPLLFGLVLLVTLVLPTRAGNYPFPNSVSHALASAPARFHASNPTPAVGLLGYTTPMTVDTTQIKGLDLLLRRYAQDSLPVVDYSNEPGVLYFLLNRVPGSQFYIQEVVQTEAAQRKFITDLKQSQPPVVVFHNSSFGFPDINGVPNSVRSYGVTYYLLTHYKPLVNYKGQLLLLRDDLVDHAPPVPDLPFATVTDLYFSSNECGLGDIPNYFTPPAPDKRATSISPRLKLVGTQTDTVQGWAIDPRSKRPVQRVIAVSSSGKVVATAVPTEARPDVAFAVRNLSARDSGFTLHLHQSESEKLTYYGLTKDGVAFLILPKESVRGVSASPPTPVITYNGREFLTYSTFGEGWIEVGGFGQKRVYQVEVPAGIDPRTFPWVSISSPNLAQLSFAITPDPSGYSSNRISFKATASPPAKLTVPAQACLQWYGYQPGRTMYLIESGVAQPTAISMTLTSGELLHE